MTITSELCFLAVVTAKGALWAISGLAVLCGLVAVASGNRVAAQKRELSRASERVAQLEERLGGFREAVDHAEALVVEKDFLINELSKDRDRVEALKQHVVEMDASIRGLIEERNERTDERNRMAAELSEARMQILRMEMMQAARRETAGNPADRGRSAAE